MKQLITESDAVGKIVESIEECGYNYLVITFTDDTMLVAQARCGGDGDAMVEVADEVSCEYEQLQLGIITQKEYDEYLEKEKQREQDRKNVRERTEYERLKKKFDK